MPSTKHFFIGLLIATCIFSINAQDHKHEEGHHNHHNHKNEIGVANSYVYFLKEKEFAYSMHLHALHTIGESKYSYGIGYERIFNEHKHNTVGIIVAYMPIEGLNFNISPGIAFESGEHSEPHFALHLETLYELSLGNFHVGPSFEFAYDKEDIHLSLGLHIGYGF